MNVPLMAHFANYSLFRSAMAAPRVGIAVSLLAALLMLISTTMVSATTEAGSTDRAKETHFLVYFSHDVPDGDPYDCTAVFPVERSVPKTRAIATAALQELFRGPTQREREAGYRSFFSSETTGLLRRLRVAAGHAYLDLHDMRAALSNATSSCGAAELRSQIERTLLQFPSITRVIYAIEGDPRAFYEWINEPCDETNKGCDPQPFRTQP